MTTASDDDALPVVRAVDLDDGDTLPRWLVDTLWARAAVGVLGGAPKCCKSWLALDLAVSVATGRIRVVPVPIPSRVSSAER